MKRKGRQSNTVEAPPKISDEARLESILKNTPKLIFARRISRALSQVSKGSPLTADQAREVLEYVLVYLESHPDANLEEGLPEVVSTQLTT